MKHRIFHLTGALLAAFVIAGIPAIRIISLGGRDVDAVSQASIVIPDEPSGEFVILINESRHEETLSDWESFFYGSELPVIFDDISCLIASGDVLADEAAQRYMAQLPENQMSLRHDEGALVASKAEAGFIDVVIMSAEMADDLALKRDIPGVRTLIIKSGERQEI